jgi:HEPN domain-containing protein
MNVNKEQIYRNNFARQSFLNIADYDYISARTLFRNECYDQFLQLAQQTLEKYLKTILLFNGIKNQNRDHSLVSLLQKCEKEIDYIKFDNETKSIIEKLNYANHGRYLTYSFSGSSDYLLELDRAVMMIRRFCQSDTSTAKMYSQTDSENLRKKYSSGKLVSAGKIESIIKNPKKYKKLYSNLIWNNFYLGTRRKNKINLMGVRWAKNSPLTVIDDIKFYEAIEDYVHLPKDIREYFKNGCKNKSQKIKPDSVIFKEMFKK